MGKILDWLIQELSDDDIFELEILEDMDKEDE